MKFIHTSDLHIGKTVHEFSMLEEQKYVLKQIIQIAVQENVDALVIAGDIYDRSIPPAEAVNILDAFLTELVENNIAVIAVSGNHDSPERLNFASNILKEKQVYIAGTYQGELRQVELEDEYGSVYFTLLPFIKPGALGCATYQESVEMLLSDHFDANGIGEKVTEKQEEKKKCRQVLITHYFVTNNGKEPQLSDSETSISVGGIENVEADILAKFDYAALGHIHRAQKIGEHNIYYAGSPLKYSFSEADYDKSVYVVELKEKGNLNVQALSLKPLHNMRKIKGKLNELVQPEVYSMEDKDDYIQAALTDKDELLDPIYTLRRIYPNTMQIILEKNKTTSAMRLKVTAGLETKTAMELFDDFYTLVTGSNPDEVKRSIISEVIEEAEREERQ